MSIIVLMMIIYSLSYIIRNLAGPFNLFSWIRNKLISNKLVGVFFYELLSCPWCIGFHCGYIVYIINTLNLSISKCFLWGLFGSFICFLFDQLFDIINLIKDKYYEKR